MRTGQAVDGIIAKEATRTRPKVDAKRSEAQESGWEDQSRMNYVIQEEEVEESIKEEASIETSLKLANQQLEENPSGNQEQSETEGEVQISVSEF